MAWGRGMGRTCRGVAEDERWEDGIRRVEVLEVLGVGDPYPPVYLDGDRHLIELSSANPDYVKCFQKYKLQRKLSLPSRSSSGSNLSGSSICVKSQNKSMMWDMPQ